MNINNNIYYDLLKFLLLFDNKIFAVDVSVIIRKSIKDNRENKEISNNEQEYFFDKLISTHCISYIHPVVKYSIDKNMVKNEIRKIKLKSLEL